MHPIHICFINTREIIFQISFIFSENNNNTDKINRSRQILQKQPNICIYWKRCKLKCKYQRLKYSYSKSYCKYHNLFDLLNVFHRQLNSFTSNIYFDYPYFYMLVQLYYFVRIGYKPICQIRNMY